MPSTHRRPAACAAPEHARQSRALLLAVAAVVVACLALPAARAAPAPGPADGDAHACPDGTTPVEAGGVSYGCSHGDDAHLAHSSRAVAATTAATASPPAQLVCDPEATDRRIQVIYAHGDGASRWPQIRPTIQGAAARAQAVFDHTAAAQGAGRALLPRFAATRNGDDCLLDVQVEQVSPQSLASFQSMIVELRDRGYDDRSRVYLVMAEADVYCGLATFYQDSDPSADDNLNNARSRPGWARVDEFCWGYAEAHEIAHTLGAVQASAPNATTGGHCSDGHDVMCYDDGTASAAPYGTSACPDPADQLLLDCGRDDYYSLLPAASGYLAEHWNMANSDWLFTTEVRATVPGTPQPGEQTPPDPEPTPDPEPDPTPEPEPNPEPTGPRFDDVPADHLFQDAIEAIADAGITSGCNNAGSRFCPDAPVTRGQMAAFLTRALDLPAGHRDFDDVPREHIFSASIAALADADITRGCNAAGSRFCPEDPVTRGQMAAFLTRALDLPAGHGDFEDTQGHLFAAPISSLAEAGITRGCNPGAGNTRFCPDDHVTRGQMAAFLTRALGL